MRAPRFVKISLLALAVLTGLWLSVGRFFGQEKDDADTFRTVPVKKGNLISTISASGVLEPEEVIDVGAQVAGRIVAFGKDPSGKTIDYGSAVKEGMVLARIDDALYAADVAMARAQLDSSKTGVLRAEADLRQLQARLYQAERHWNRVKELGPSKALSYTDYDAAQSAYEIAKANVDVGTTSVAQAKDAVTPGRGDSSKSAAKP